MASQLIGQEPGAVGLRLELAEPQAALAGAQGWVVWLATPVRSERKSAPGVRWANYNSDRS